MELAKIVALIAFVCVVIIGTSGNARAQGDRRAHARHLAALAAEKQELKELETRARREAPPQATPPTQMVRNAEFARRCRIKAVMTDAEIESCRQALYSM